MTTYWIGLGAMILATILLSLIFRRRTARLIRLGKALATDKRLPRPVRGLFAVAMAIKLIPGPDFGIDEGLLLIGALLMAGPYRAQFKAIREETRYG